MFVKQSDTVSHYFCFRFNGFFFCLSANRQKKNERLFICEIVFFMICFECVLTISNRYVNKNEANTFLLIDKIVTTNIELDILMDGEFLLLLSARTKIETTKNIGFLSSDLFHSLGFFFFFILFWEGNCSKFNESHKKVYKKNQNINRNKNENYWKIKSKAKIEINKTKDKKNWHHPLIIFFLCYLRTNTNRKIYWKLWMSIFGKWICNWTLSYCLAMDISLF